jgi:hypothetical protein
VVVLIDWPPTPGMARCRDMRQVADVQRAVPKSVGTVMWSLVDRKQCVEPGGRLSAAAQLRMYETSFAEDVDDLCFAVAKYMFKLAACPMAATGTIFECDAVLRANRAMKNKKRPAVAAGTRDDRSDLVDPEPTLTRRRPK